MKPPENTEYLLFGGTFVLANKLQFMGDKLVEGIPTKQWFLLRNMIDMPQNPPPAINQIAAAMDSTRQNISKMLEVMEREGYVTLEKSQSDKRSQCVRITEKGFACAQKKAEDAQNFLNDLYKGISKEEQIAAGKVLVKMVENLQAMEERMDS